MPPKLQQEGKVRKTKKEKLKGENKDLEKAKNKEAKQVEREEQKQIDKQIINYQLSEETKNQLFLAIQNIGSSKQTVAGCFFTATEKTPFAIQTICIILQEQNQKLESMNQEIRRDCEVMSFEKVEYESIKSHALQLNIVDELLKLFMCSQNNQKMMLKLLYLLSWVTKLPNLYVIRKQQTQFLNHILNLQNAKKQFLQRKGIFKAFMLQIIQIVENYQPEKLTDQVLKKIIKVIRNLLSIPDPTNENYHNQLIKILSQDGCFETLIYLVQDFKKIYAQDLK